jgi:eukaryotic-like serine/threonine-protein kinase
VTARLPNYALPPSAHGGSHPSGGSSSSRPTVLAGRYALRAEIGRGGCAVVYEAQDLRLGRVVALKLVRSGARDTQAHARLAREARAGAAIHHPNVCGLSDAGYLEDGRPYLVMERLQGETLTALLQRRGVLAFEEAIDIGLQLLSALDAAHNVGVVHRDVKPDNVFLVQRAGCAPLVKLLDFGMCRRASAQLEDDMTLTNAGQVVGTPEYMSPEQVSGKRSFDARIDVYAVGVMLYEALTGQRAFIGKDAREVVVSVLSRNLPAIRSLRSDIPTTLEHVIARAMARDPHVRYSSATKFQRDLLEAKAQIQAQRAMQTSRRRRSIEEPERQVDEWDAPTRQLHAPRRAAGMF